MARPPVDYYAVLKITPRASPAEINKAYKTLALITHPDKNPSPGAKEAFQEVSTYLFPQLHFHPFLQLTLMMRDLCETDGVERS